MPDLVTKGTSPRAEDVLLEVPIEPSRSRRSPKSSTVFEPLRIYLHYDESVLSLPSEKQLFVNSSLLPEAAGYWEDVLRVARTGAPIRLRRKCTSSFYYYRNEKKTVACDRACRAETNCGETTIPKEHLLECSYCLTSDDCYTSGEQGEGVKDADFILYVTAISTKRCDSVDTLAYAAHCQQEALLDRNRYGKPISFNKEFGYYDWDRNTITTVLRDDWWTGEGKVSFLLMPDRGELPTPFCNEIKHDGRKSLGVARCTSQRDSLAICNLVPYKKELPLQFRNFAKLEGVSSGGVKHYGGTVELADYCPYSQEFQWKLPNSTIRQDSRCELEGNNRDGEDILEVYGTSSRCFDFKQPWRERKCGRVRSLLHYMAGCYEHSCQNGTLYVAVHDSEFYPCYYAGQHVHIRRFHASTLS
ncbi:hypothetical protein GCK32_011452 [Trichostrongylus colubriformis]|uniref:Leishmanolysin-like peptidase n=1 Tax=Trichostrongylus colubriformis TaxID=6319 RepID=A0AAN8FLF1_TRICO